LLRWGLANPIYPKDHKQLYIKYKNFDNISSKIFEFLMTLSEIGITTQQDCPLPTCFFDDKLLAYLVKQNNINLNMGRCNPVCDITPNLEIVRCLPLFDINRTNFTKFKSVWEIYYYFKNKIDIQLIKIPSFEKCKKCRYYAQEICQGGCLSYKLKILNEEKTVTSDDFNKLLKSMRDC